jgi:hypothetical protein
VNQRKVIWSLLKKICQPWKTEVTFQSYLVKGRYHIYIYISWTYNEKSVSPTKSFEKNE